MKLLVAILAIAPVFAIDPSQMVVLEMRSGVRGGCGPALIDFFRNLPDGSTQSAPFRVPEGMSLVVTDVDWHYYSGLPSQLQVLRLLIENLAKPEIRRRAFESTVMLNNAGLGGRSERMTTGFVVSSAGRLCLDVLPGPLGDPVRLNSVIVRGYLSR
ncbi:MAG TPA: hypothetical protein DEH78_02915 [Solibacterales bacterium]|nr:hypothetical protein [Bryobacterales bacterium]